MKNKGITLIALVITIIVLLILAGVTISLVLGENGIIKQAKRAEQDYSRASIKEELELEILDLQADIYEKEGRTATLKDLEQKLNSENCKITIIHEEIEYAKAEYKGYSFLIDTLLNIDTIKIKTTEDIIKEWLLTVNEKETKTLEEILNDNVLLSKLLNTKESVNYMMKYKNVFVPNIFVNNTNAMKIIANSQYTMDKIVDDGDWTIEILNNNNAIEILDNSNPRTVPTMTDYTKPEGEVFCSSEWSGLHRAWYPFGGRVDWESANGGMPAYIGYKFEEPVWVYKCYIKNSNDSAPREMQLQKSDDGINWVSVFNNFTFVGLQQKATDVIKSENNVGRAKYWRLYITKATLSNEVDIEAIQFYGK